MICVALDYLVVTKFEANTGLQLPYSGTSLHNGDDEDDALRPPAPLKTSGLQHPNSSSASTKSQRAIDNMNTFRAPTPQRKGVPRKPAPTINPSFSLSTKSSSETIRGPGREKSTTPEYGTHPSERNQPRSRGFGLGNVVKEKVTGRRKPLDAPSSETIDPLEAPSPIAVAKPPNFVSIDDWLDTREREGLHRRSNTVTTVSTQATRYNEPIRLHIRQSTFAPLPTPHELAPPESVPKLPPIPQQYMPTVPPTSSTHPPQLTQRPPSPPRTPPKDEQPRDHIEQLEYEQEQLEVRRSAIRREMWDLEQLLPPNPSTHNPVAREDMGRRLTELAKELADVEKEVHETGMKLHRAWRRRDKKMGIEGPTHLWVSRVSGP